MTVPNYPGDPNDKTDDTPFDALKDKSLKAAGYAYLVGDASLFTSGMMAGRHKEAASGLLWGVGGLVCAKYANPSAEKQLKLLGSRLGDYLRKEGVEIPVNAEVKDLLKPGGVIDTVESFLYKYPSQVLNATYAVGAGTMVRSGLQHNKKWDIASGALIAAGALSGLLIHEKAPDPENPPKTAFAKAASWLQEKPLRISGGFFAVNNAALIMSALNERKENPAQKSYMFKFLTAASYIFGNSMLAMSSKENKGNKEHCDEALEKLSTASAQIIAAQPKEVQDGLVQHIAAFLSAQPEVTEKADSIAAMLQQKLSGVHAAPQQSGWMAKLNLADMSAATPGI